jgi:hypothetical protein
MPLKVTFLWEEDDPMSYSGLLDRLASLGAYDIDSEKTAPESVRKTPSKKEKPGRKVG